MASFFSRNKSTTSTSSNDDDHAAHAASLEKLVHAKLIKDLLAENKTDVESVLKTVREWVQTGADGTPNITIAAESAPLDELFVLRFILSNPLRKNTQDAVVDKIKQTLIYRAQHHEDLIAAANGTCTKLEPFYAYFCRGFIGRFGNHAFFLERHGHNNYPRLNELIHEYSRKDNISLSDAMLLVNEYYFRIVDKLTRESGYLSKVVNIFPLDQLPLFFPPSAMKVVWAYGTSSKKSSIYYPQLVGAGVVFSSQSLLVKMVMSLGNTFVSKSSMEKVVICPGFKPGVAPAACPALRHIDKSLNWSEAFPTVLNGSAPCPPSVKSRRFSE